MTIENGATPESSTGAQPAESSYLDDVTGAKPSAGESPSPASADANQPSSEPSTEPGAKQPSAKPTPLDVVKKAMADTKAGESPAQPEKTPPSDKAAAEGDKPDANKQKDEDLPFHNHPRWKEVMAENRTLREQAAEFEGLKEPAERYTKLNGFLIENNLSGQDFTNMLNIGVAMKTDPEKALQMLEPFYNALLRMNGQIIPDDIQAKLDQGVIDQETAKTMAVERARSTNLNQQLETERERRAQQQQQTQQEREHSQRVAHVQKIQEAVKTWETTWQQSDTDYSMLMPFVRDRITTKVQQKPPTNPEEAVAIAEAAKKEIMTEMGKMKPKTAVNTVPTAVNTNRPPNAAPKNGLDVVRNALAATS